MAGLACARRGRGASNACPSLEWNRRGLTSATSDDYFVSWRSRFALERPTNAVSSVACFARVITTCLGLKCKTTWSTFISEAASYLLNDLIRCVFPVLSSVPSTHNAVLWELQRENVHLYVSTPFKSLVIWKERLLGFIIIFKLSSVTLTPENQTSCSVGGSWNCKAVLAKKIFFSKWAFWNCQCHGCGELVEGALKQPCLASERRQSKIFMFFRLCTPSVRPCPAALSHSDLCLFEPLILHPARGGDGEQFILFWLRVT